MISLCGQRWADGSVLTTRAGLGHAGVPSPRWWRPVLVPTPACLCPPPVAVDRRLGTGIGVRWNGKLRHNTRWGGAPVWSSRILASVRVGRAYSKRIK
jgi:hypothetical protein